MIFPGLSVGGIDKMILKVANVNEPIKIPNIITIRLREFQNENMSMPNMNGTKEKMIPNINDPQISPNKIVLMEIGQVISRSRVFCLASQGKTTGPIEAAVKNKTIAMRPDIR